MVVLCGVVMLCCHVVSGVVDVGQVEWLILCCFGVLLSDNVFFSESSPKFFFHF